MSASNPLTAYDIVTAASELVVETLGREWEESNLALDGWLKRLKETRREYGLGHPVYVAQDAIIEAASQRWYHAFDMWLGMGLHKYGPEWGAIRQKHQAELDRQKVRRQAKRAKQTA